MGRERFTIDVKVDLTISNLTVSVEEGSDDLRTTLRKAAQEVINERLMLLDTYGGRSGNDGFIDDNDVSIVLNWNRE